MNRLVAMIYHGRLGIGKLISGSLRLFLQFSRHTHFVINSSISWAIPGQNMMSCARSFDFSTHVSTEYFGKHFWMECMIIKIEITIFDPLSMTSFTQLLSLNSCASLPTNLKGLLVSILKTVVVIGCGFSNFFHFLVTYWKLHKQCVDV